MHYEDHPKKAERDYALSCVHASWFVVTITALGCYDSYTRYQVLRSSPNLFATLGPALGYRIVGHLGLIGGLALTATGLFLGGRSRWLAACTMIVVGLFGLLWWMMHP